MMKLVDMYRAELEYLSGKYGRTHFVYVYDKTDSVFSTLCTGKWPYTKGKWPHAETYIEFDLGLILVHLCEIEFDKDSPNMQTYRHSVIRHPGVGKKKSVDVVVHHKFDLYQILNGKNISLFKYTLPWSGDK